MDHEDEGAELFEDVFGLGEVTIFWFDGRQGGRCIWARMVLWLPV